MSGFGQILFSALLCATAILPGCDSAGNIVAGIDRGGVSGPISGFGSVIVNGKHYEIDLSTAISINGQPAIEDDLEVGYVVFIQADIPQDGSAPQATTIKFSHNVIGPMTTVSIVDNQITVLGQSVTVDDLTTYGPGISPASIDGLAALADSIVRVSGFVRADDSILATRIDRAGNNADIEVTGVVINIDTVVQTFEVGGLLVNYGAANLQGFPSGQPKIGDRIKAEGVLSAGGILVANELELKEIDLDVDEGDEFEIEGLITDFTSITSFSVSGIPVITDTATNFEGGDASMLGLNVRVEIEGRLGSNGVIEADNVEFKPDGPLLIEAPVDSVEPLMVWGLLITTDSQTIFEDKSSVELRPFSTADINAGDPLRVTGYVSLEQSGGIVATGITRTEPLEKLTLRGTAENVVSPGFSILDIPVIIDGNTDIETNFFAIAEGRLVEVKGSTETGSLVAEKVEIED